jgi:hypothetical protein
MVKHLYRAIIAIFISGSSLLFSSITDNQTYAPPDYTTFQPPSVGGTYIDPVFGTAIKRLTNAMAMKRNDLGTGATLVTAETEYSTMSAFNQDNSRLILAHFSYFGLYDAAANYIRDLPFEINASSEPRWSRKDPNVLYYHRTNQLKQYNVATSTMTVVHTFSEYTGIKGNGESDISLDGDHFVLQGDGKVFVYTISTDTKGPAFDTGGRSFDSLYITPNNNVTITWNVAGTARYNGIELFDQNMNFLRQVAHAGGHMDVTRDVNGDEVLIWTNAADALPIPNCANGLVKIRLADAKQTCLLALGWGRAVHISAPDAGWVLVETFYPTDVMPPDWRPYTNEFFQLPLDGSQPRRIAHHRSRPFNSYVYQPRATVSRDGTKFVYSSNYGLQAQLAYPSSYSDVYMIEMAGRQTITFNPIPDKTYADATFTLNATASSNLPVTFTAAGVCTVSGNTVTLTAPGSCAITAHQAGDSYFTPAADVTQSFTVARTAQTITFNALSDRTFGDSSFNVSATASSSLPVSFTAAGACTASGSTVTVTAPGSCAVTAQQSGDAYFTPAADVTQSFTVVRAAQAITFNAFADRTYGEAAFNVSATASSSLPVSFTAAGGACTVSGSAVTLTAAGSCAVTAHQAGDTYFAPASDVTQAFTVARAAQNITFAPLPNQTLGAAPFALSASASSQLPVTFLSAGSCTLSGNIVTSTAAGSCTVTAQQQGDTNYLAAADVPQTFTIDQLNKLYRIEQNNSRVLWSGMWSGNNLASHSGGSANLAMGKNAKVSFTFTGTQITWIAYRDQWSGLARVYVDGALAATVDTYSAGAKAQTPMYTATVPSGTHTITIEVAGTK